MLYDAATEIRLSRLEKEIEEKIRTQDVPFIGLYKIDSYEALDNAIQERLVDFFDPLGLFINSLGRWPAVFCSYLVRHVAEGYGSRGNHEVYPYIEKAIQADLTTAQREKLWNAFRHACIQVCLSVSPRRSGTNYMVDEYLRQTGVPLRFVDELAGKMLSYSYDVGTPDDDDPAAIHLWQKGLQTRIRYLQQPVQKAIEADDGGFYTRLFIKILNNPSSTMEDVSDIEKRFIEQIELLQRKGGGRSSSRRKILSIPQVVFRDGQVAIELPADENVTWRVEVDGQHRDYFGSLESRVVSLEEELPNKVSVRALEGSSQISAILWDDEKNNRFLIFSESGGLISKGQLGQADTILLEPGTYSLLLRFEPSGLEDETECLSDDPVLVHYQLTLDPAEKFEVSRGLAKAVFRADTKPSLHWEGRKYRGIFGNELFASAGLKLEVKVPEELSSLNYELKVTPGGLADGFVIPIDIEDDKVLVDFADYMGSWKPGLSRLLVELRPQGHQRAEVRSSIYLWNGLSQVKNRTCFVCSELPPENNLLLADSDNVKIDPTQKTVTFKNEDQRLFRMVFQATESRKQPFTWSVPGVFMQVLDYQEQHATEKPLKKGSTLSVTGRSREVIEVFSSNNGTLSLGRFKKYVNFDKSGRARIPLAGLVEYLGPNADSLCFMDEKSTIPESLVRLVSPHQILGFNVSPQVGGQVLRFNTKDEIEEISLNFKDMITGWSKDISIACNSTEVKSEDGFSVWFSCSQNSPSSTHEHEIQFFLENWPNGAWFCTLNGKTNGRWGRFSNSRNDFYAFGLLVVGNQAYRSGDVSWKYIQKLDVEEKETILKRIHRRLLNCYAKESWEQIEWLGFLWEKLTDELASHGAPSSRVISLGEEQHDDTNNASWIPMYSLVSRCPSLYSQFGRSYRDLPNPRQRLSVKCLKVLGQMKYGALSLIIDGTLHPLVAFGFSNAMEMNKGSSPKGFDLKRFEQILKMDDISEKIKLLRQHEWQPGDGDYLGALHYHYASEQFKNNYHASMAGNEFRRGKLLSLCRNMSTIPLHDVPKNLSNGHCTLDLSTEIYDEEHEISVDEEHIQLITKFLSQYAKACRWEVRNPGTLETVLKRVLSHLGSQKDVDMVLGYLLSLGKDVFMYYLMLWEVVFKSDVDHQEGRIYVRK
jgi:hypothetical protein